MELTWWGTAHFRLDSGGETILIDPYLSRNRKAWPVVGLTPAAVTRADRILVTHGHFDHIMDVPAIAAQTRARVYADPVAGATLVKNGLDPHQLETVTTDGQAFDFGAVGAQAHFSRHVVFDRHLLLTTLAKINIRFFEMLKYLRDYPCGQVLSWRLAAVGATIHHFGSAGAAPEELARLAARPTDVLLVPLQGHTRICEIALGYVKALKPRVVIPHHQDDFFPPISRMVDIEPFLKAVKDQCPASQTRVASPGAPIPLRP
jgi:L-ascorbate metabolism protein UlaG (beta-lactamase superfamily)